MRAFFAFWREWTFGLVLGAIFIAASVLTPVACSSVTDPPPNWPPTKSCADDPNGPGCYGGLHDMKARDGGR